MPQNMIFRSLSVPLHVVVFYGNRAMNISLSKNATSNIALYQLIGWGYLFLPYFIFLNIKV